MKKTILEIYALFVCFATLICLTVSTGIALYDVVQIVNPELTLDSSNFEAHQSNMDFVEYEPENYDGLTDDEITQARLDSLRFAIKVEARDGLASLIEIAIIIFVNLIIFFIHWRIARGARSS